jgi:hypothetical protein
VRGWGNNNGLAAAGLAGGPKAKISAGSTMKED